MVLYTDKLKVIHVTTHIALRQFLDTLGRERVETVIGMADTFLKRVGFDNPRIAVAGVNPHAGENGLFGDEEITIVGPSVEAMKDKGLKRLGPVPAGYRFPAVLGRPVRHGGGDVSRSGPYSAKAAGLL